MALQIYLNENPQVTFGKSLYSRCTDHFTYSKNVQFTNNRIKIEPLKYLDPIININLAKHNDIKFMSMFLVDNDIDINTLTINTDTDELRIQVIHKVSMCELYSYNKMTFMSKIDDYIKIPHNDICIVPNLIAKRDNKRIVIIIDNGNNQNIESEIIIEYLVLTDNTERRRFDQVVHEYLFRRLLSKTFLISKGKNIIPLKYGDNLIAYFLLTTLKESYNNIKLKFVGYKKCKYGEIEINETEYTDEPEDMRNKIIAGNIIKIEQEMREIQFDHKYRICENEKYDVYIQDPHTNITNGNSLNRPYDLRNHEPVLIEKSGYQPFGNYILDENSYIEIMSNIETSITLTTCIFDIFTLLNNRTYFKSQYVEPPEPDVEPIIPIIHVAPVIHIAQDENPREYHDEIQYYGNLVLPFLQIIQILTAFPKVPNDDQCIISFEKIGFGKYYYECDQCGKGFLYRMYSEWFRRQTRDKTCPHCRKILSTYPRLYINIHYMYIIVAIMSILVYFFI